MNFHSCNPSPRSTSSSVVRTTLFAEWNWIHSALDVDDIDKWGCRLENETKGKTLSKTHYHYLFLKGWKWRYKSWTVRRKCRDGRYNPIQGQLWQQETISSRQTSPSAVLPGNLWWRPRVLLPPFQVISKAMFQLQSSHLKNRTICGKSEVFSFSLFDNF